MSLLIDNKTTNIETTDKDKEQKFLLSFIQSYNFWYYYIKN
jgi:hypothetical protein